MKRNDFHAKHYFGGIRSKRRGSPGAVLALVAALGMTLPAPGRDLQRDVFKGQVEIDMGRYESVQLRPGQDPDLALALALPGGGHRSSNCVAGVFLALEQMGLLQEVDYFPTVSGSGCIVAAYLAALHRHNEIHGTPEGFSFERALQERPNGRRGRTVADSLATDYQKVIVRQGLLRDAAPRGKDRGDHFEAFLDDELLHGLTMGDIFRPAGSGEIPTLPYWFADSSINRNAAIFTHAPDIYEVYQLTRYPHRGRMRRFDGNYYEVPMSVALKASMGFPVLVPPTVFESDMHPDLRHLPVKDGGLAQNVPCTTALSVLRQDSAAQKVLIVVDVNITRFEPFEEDGDVGGMFRQMVDASRIAIDSQIHRYRGQLVRKDIHRDANGRILCGRTLDGIEVIFLHPELLPKASANAVKDVGMTLNVDADTQQMLFAAGWEMARRQGKPLCGIVHPGAGGDIGDFSVSVAAAETATGVEAGAFPRVRKLRSRIGGGRSVRW